MDYINTLAAILTIVTSFWAIITHYRLHSLKKHIESGLIGIIGQLDKINSMDSLPKYNKKNMASSAGHVRDHAISLLRSFSNADHRHPSYDFGLNSEEIEDKTEERKKQVGISYEGCIVNGSLLRTKNGNRPAEEIQYGDAILAQGEDKFYYTDILSKNEYKIEGYITVNDQLNITANHKVWVDKIGYVLASQLTIGDSLLGYYDYVTIQKLEYSKIQENALAIKTEAGNLFVNDVLVHNEEEEK